VFAPPFDEAPFEGGVEDEPAGRAPPAPPPPMLPGITAAVEIEEGVAIEGGRGLVVEEVSLEKGTLDCKEFLSFNFLTYSWTPTDSRQLNRQLSLFGA
jgi:hypothetical protein